MKQLRILFIFPMVLTVLLKNIFQQNRVLLAIPAILALTLPLNTFAADECLLQTGQPSDYTGTVSSSNPTYSHSSTVFWNTQMEENRKRYYIQVADAGQVIVTITNGNGDDVRFSASVDICPGWENTGTHWEHTFTQAGDFNIDVTAWVRKDQDQSYTITVTFTPMSSQENTQTNNPGFRDFRLRQRLTHRGNMVTIGNTILVAPQPQDPQNEQNQVTPGVFNCANYTDGPYYDNAPHANNFYTLCPYKSDGTRPSTSAKAEEGNATNKILPGSTLVWAGLYWQSIVRNETGITGHTIQIKNGNDAYENVRYNVLDYGQDVGQTGYTSYSAFADVTKLLQDHGWLTGTYTVANIPTETANIPELGQYGAWTLVLVYQNSSMKMRSFSIFDGWQRISGRDGPNSNPTVNVPIKGFYTPKKTPINSTVSVFTAEGDLYIKGDHLFALAQNDTNDTNDTELTTFDSSITPQSMERTPKPTNNQGIDIQSFQIGTDGKNLLRPKQQNITFQFTTKTTGEARDTYFPSLITFNTEIYAPDLCYDYTYGQEGFFKIAPDTDKPYIKETLKKDKPLDIKLYVRNREDSDVILKKAFIHIKDINTTQAVYKRNSTDITSPDGILKHVPDSGREVADSKDMNISIGTVDGLQHFYTYFSLDLKKENIDMPINAYFQYDLTMEGIPLGTQEMPLKDMPICQDSQDYLPIYGEFNVVHPSESKSNDPYYFYNLPTQVVKRPNPYRLEAMTGAPNFNNSRRATEEFVMPAAVDLIDADGFHFVAATCTDPKAVPFNKQRVWTVIREGEYAHDINQTLLSQYGFFDRAVSNAAFRISFSTMPDNTIVTFTKKSNHRYRLSNLSREATNQCYNKCSTFLSDNGGNIDNNATLSICMECLYEFNAKKLCSRDNFSVRPEAYAITLHDKNSTASNVIAVNTPTPTPAVNLAAGYPYDIEVNATDHLNSSTPAPRYHADEVNATLQWVHGSYDPQCNDTEDNESSISFWDGHHQKERQLDQVGTYTLHLLDSTWTRVDHIGTYMRHHVATLFRGGTDCTEDSTLVRPTVSIGKNGCDISSQHNNTEYQKRYTDMKLRFYPYTFNQDDLNNTIGPTTRTSGQSFIYINTPPRLNAEDKDMSYNLNGGYYASGKNGSHLSNFVKDCYADNLNMTLTFSYIGNAPTAEPYLSYSLKETNSTHTNIIYRPESGSNHYEVNTTVTTNNNLTVIPLTISQQQKYFAKDMNGSVYMNLGFNYNRDYNKTLNPRYITFRDFSITYAANPTPMNADMRNNYQIFGNKDLDQNVTFIYGRARPERPVFDNITANAVKTPISIEAYCDQNLLWCQTNGLVSITDSPLADIRSNKAVWWTVEKHNAVEGDGNVTLLLSATAAVTGESLIPASPTRLIFTNGIDKNVTVGYTGPTRPHTVKVGFDTFSLTNIASSDRTSRWLIYNEDNNSIPVPFYRVRFIGSSGWTGGGKTGHVVGNKINKKKARRTEW